MRTVRIVKASDIEFISMRDMPDEVFKYFEKLSKEFHHSNFIVETDPDTYEEGTEASAEIMVYDDYVE